MPFPPRTLLPPDHPDSPKFWRYETSGKLEPVVMAYLNGAAMSMQEVAIMRVYLRQWIASPVWGGGEGLEKLRRDVEMIRSRPDITRWLHNALDEGIDPL